MWKKDLDSWEVVFFGGEDRCCDAADGQLFLCAREGPDDPVPVPFLPSRSDLLAPPEWVEGVRGP